ncbi:hypothetical protein [Sphingomonas parapaucimobilis]|nr:hypothetical protein [Sphingomonas parapaucimobilis]
MAKDQPNKPAAAAQNPVRPAKPSPQYVAKLRDGYETKDQRSSRDHDKKA